MATVQMLSAAEAAERLNLSVVRVQQLCKDGRIVHQRVGRSYAIPADELRKFSKIERPPGRPREDE